MKRNHPAGEGRFPRRPARTDLFRTLDRSGTPSFRTFVLTVVPGAVITDRTDVAGPFYYRRIGHSSGVFDTAVNAADNQDVEISLLAGNSFDVSPTFHAGSVLF